MDYIVCQALLSMGKSKNKIKLKKKNNNVEVNTIKEKSDLSTKKKKKKNTGAACHLSMLYCAMIVLFIVLSPQYKIIKGGLGKANSLPSIFQEVFSHF